MTNQLHDLPPLLTVEEAAELLRIGRNSAYEAIRRDELPHIRIGRAIRIPTSRLLDWAGIPQPEPLPPWGADA